MMPPESNRVLTRQARSSRLVLPTPLRPRTQVTLPRLWPVSDTLRSACARTVMKIDIVDLGVVSASQIHFDHRARSPKPDRSSPRPVLNLDANDRYLDAEFTNDDMAARLSTTTVMMAINFAQQFLLFVASRLSVMPAAGSSTQHELRILC